MELNKIVASLLLVLVTFGTAYADPLLSDKLKSLHLTSSEKRLLEKVKATSKDASNITLATFPDLIAAYGEKAASQKKLEDLNLAVDLVIALNQDQKVLSDAMAAEIADYLVYPLRSKDNWEEESKIIERTIPIFVKGNDYDSGAVYAMQIGDAYRKAKQLDKALALLNDALIYAEKALGPDHVYLKDYFNSLGKVHHQRGEADDAIRYYKRAEEVLKNAKKPDEKLMAYYGLKVAVVLESDGRKEEAAAQIEYLKSTYSKTALQWAFREMQPH
ncbi:MAG: tetratricopeptide repeat protein [Methylocystaceae bacterium]|nr:tetratricopeptide repeat protein [Methylocystaceae bacterium]